MNSKTKLLPVPVILGACLLIALIWAYWPVLTNLFEQLLTDEDYSFGLLLPLVSGYIVYLKWPEIRQMAMAAVMDGVSGFGPGIGPLYCRGSCPPIFIPLRVLYSVTCRRTCSPGRLEAGSPAGVSSPAFTPDDSLAAISYPTAHPPLATALFPPGHRNFAN